MDVHIHKLGLIFSVVWAPSSNLGKINLDATTFSDILDKFASNSVATVWERPFPVSAWQYPRAESEVHKEMFFLF